MEKRFTLMGQVVINGYTETVFLTKYGFKMDDFSEDDLILFQTENEAWKYAELNGHDLAEPVCVSEVF